MNLCDTSEYHQLRMKMVRGEQALRRETRRAELRVRGAWSLYDEVEGEDCVLSMATEHETVCFLLEGVRPPLSAYVGVDQDLSKYTPINEAEKAERLTVPPRR